MRKHMQKAVAAAFVAAMTVGLPATALAKGDVTRLGGATRYDTMSAIVSEGFPTSPWAIIATGKNFPDALAASTLAGVKNCPIILTDSNSLSSQASAQLTKLHTKYAFIVGGTSAISADTEKAIQGIGVETTRVSGSDRVGTSLEIMKAVKNATVSDSLSNTVIIAAGKNFPDSLSISPWAYASKSPIVLASNDGTLTTAAIQGIKDYFGDAKTKNIIIVGGTAAVGDGVKTQLGSGYTITRLSGADRYLTSAAIYNWELGKGMNYNKLALATGENFPDALAGSALCGQADNNSVILLTNTWYGNNIKEITDRAWDISKMYILGGESAVGADLQDTIQNALNDSKYFERPSDGERFKEIEVVLRTGGKTGKVDTTRTVSLEPDSSVSSIVFDGEKYVHYEETEGSQVVDRAVQTRSYFVEPNGTDVELTFDNKEVANLSDTIENNNDSGSSGIINLWTTEIYRNYFENSRNQRFSSAQVSLVIRKADGSYEDADPVYLEPDTAFRIPMSITSDAQREGAVAYISYDDQTVKNGEKKKVATQADNIVVEVRANSQIWANFDGNGWEDITDQFKVIEASGSGSGTGVLDLTVEWVVSSK